MPDDERHKIAYEESLRAIADQQSALDAIHNRASTIASASAVATGLLGLSSETKSLGIGGLIAVSSLLGILGIVGWILWPRREWRFHFEASKLHWNYIEGPRPLSANQMRRDLALYLESYFNINAVHLDRFGVLIGVAIILLFVDVGGVIWEVWTR
jgi:hypothetical protein